MSTPSNENELSDEKTFSNEHVHVTVTRAPGCVVKLQITANPKLSNEAYSKAIKTLRKEISLPGFRRGKVPEATVLAKFPVQVENEWKQILLRDGTFEAVELTKLYPLKDNEKRTDLRQVGESHYSRESDSTFSISFEVAPDRPTIDIEKLVLPDVKKPSVSETDFSDRLYELQLSKAQWEEVNDKALEDQDFAEIITIESGSPEESEPAPMRIWMRNDRLPENLYKALLGKKAGDSFEYVNTAESEEEPKTINVTVKSILKPTLPELDDDFAKQFGAQSVDMLKENIEASIRKDADRQFFEDISNKLIDQMLEISPMDIPDSLLKNQATIVSRQVERNLERSSPENDENERKRVLKELKDVINKRAHDIVHLRYLVHVIGQENQIVVTDKEFQNEMTELSSLVEYGMHPYIRVDDNIQELQSEVFHQLMTQKVLKHLINKLENRVES